MPDYPEHDKLIAMKPEVDAIASFLEGVQAQEITYYGEPIVLAFHPLLDEEGTRSNNLYPIPLSIVDLLAQWSGIDQNKLEVEKRAMLDVQRELNERQ